MTFSIASNCTSPRDDPADYTEEIVGQVAWIAEDSDEEEPVGKFEGYRLRCNWAANERVSFFDVADGFSQDTYDYLLEVFDEDGNVRPDVLPALGDDEPPSGLVLMAHTLQLEAKHRGKGLGYAVMNAFIDTFDPGAWIVIARAAPVNPDIRPEEMQTATFKRTRARAVRKLRRYWRRFGFVPIAPDSELLVMNLALKRPLLVDVVRQQRKVSDSKNTRLM